MGKFFPKILKPMFSEDKAETGMDFKDVSVFSSSLLLW